MSDKKITKRELREKNKSIDNKQSQSSEGVSSWFNKQSDGVKLAIGIGGICFVGLILILAVTSMYSDQNPQTTTTNTPTSNQPTWHSVANYSGSGDKTTDSFTIKGTKFKIKYSITREETDYGLFYLYVHPEGQNSNMVANFGLTDVSKLNESDESYVYEGPGTYYIETMVSSIKEWNVEIFDYY